MTAEYVSELARRALISEVDVTPKPGLVDINNNGAHKDMSRDLFLKSANVLKPYFKMMCTADVSEIREIGIEAERAMYQATNGVNTHKGAIYSLGLLCVAVCLTDSRNIDTICEKAAEIAKIITNYDDIIETNGKKAYDLYGVKGAKGEAESGFKSVRVYGLPVYDRSIMMDGDNIAAVKTLLSLMANVDDTNTISRGGFAGAEYVKNKAMELIKDFTYEDVLQFDRELIVRNISPGGCADLLAVTIFLHNVRAGI